MKRDKAVESDSEQPVQVKKKRKVEIGEKLFKILKYLFNSFIFR